MCTAGTKVDQQSTKIPSDQEKRGSRRSERTHPVRKGQKKPQGPKKKSSEHAFEDGKEVNTNTAGKGGKGGGVFTRRRGTRKGRKNRYAKTC